MYILGWRVGLVGGVWIWGAPASLPWRRIPSSYVTKVFSCSLWKFQWGAIMGVFRGSIDNPLKVLRLNLFLLLIKISQFNHRLCLRLRFFYLLWSELWSKDKPFTGSFSSRQDIVVENWSSSSNEISFQPTNITSHTSKRIDCFLGYPLLCLPSPR